MATVKFWRGTKAQFDAKVKDNDTLYFQTTNSLLYKGSSLNGTRVLSVQAFPQTPIQGVVYFNSATGESRFNDGTWKVLSPAVATTISQSSTNAQVPSALAVWNAISTLQTQIGSTIHTPVQNVTALAALTVSASQDKMLCFVQDAGSLYRYDAQATGTSSGAGDSPDIVVPASGTGNWIRMFTALDLTSGNLAITVAGSTITFKYNTSDFSVTSAGLNLVNVQRYVTGAADKVASFNSTGQVQSSGVSVGGATLASTPLSSVLATQAAVKAYADGIAVSAEVNWVQG